MLPEYFAIISAIISSAGGAYYLYKTLIGQTKPNRITWLLWGLLPLIAFTAQRAQGVESLSLVTFAAALLPLLIVLASFINKKAYWKTGWRDYLVVAGAACGVVLWALTDNPNMAILFSLVADFIAGLPTILKAYRYPKTESWLAYAISAVGFGIGILAVQNYTFENYAFVVYLFIVSSLLAFLASRKQNGAKATARH